MKWTDIEDQILISMYQECEKEKILNSLKNRSWQAIQSRASKLSLTRLNYFTKEEIQFIINNYYTMRSGEIARKLNRSSKVIERKAREIGLLKQFKWTEQEDEFIRKEYGKYSVSELCKILKKSRSSIYHKIQEFGLQDKKPDYSNISDNELLEKLISISKDIGRTPITKELFSLGLPTMRVWKKRFGSYTNACKMAGLEVNFGISKNLKTKSINDDMCSSNSEKKITDFFIENNIVYKKEVSYYSITKDKSSGRMVCDWVLSDGVLVEYFGMRTKKYKDKINRKIKLCEDNNLKIICLYEKDLNKLSDIFFHYINNP